MRRTLSGFLLVIACAAPLEAQGGAVLLLPASARAAGAGDASSLATGASAVFYGAQRLPGERSAVASTGTWIGGAQFSAIALSVPFANRASVALGVRNISYGSADEIIEDPATGGTRGTATGSSVDASELEAVLGASSRWRALRVGASLGYAHQQVAELSGSMVTWSAGAGVTVHGWDADVGVRDMSSGYRLAGRTDKPSSVGVAAIATPDWRAGRMAWRAVGEVRSSSGRGSISLVGAESAIGSSAGWTLRLRAAAVAYSDETARAPWSAGGSAERGRWALDYAYQGYGALGAVHRMGVTWHSRAARNASR